MAGSSVQTARWLPFSMAPNKMAPTKNYIDSAWHRHRAEVEHSIFQ